MNEGIKKEGEKRSFADKYGVFKHVLDVQSDIKRDLTSDFILAKLEPHQREAFVGAIANAYNVKRKMEEYVKGKEYRVGKNGNYIRNEDMTFKKFNLSKTKIDYIMNMARITFNTYMVKMITITLLQRNLKENTIVELVTERDKIMDENGRLREENKTISERVKSNIKEGVGSNGQ